MSQSHKHSMFEQMFDTTTGFLISYCVWEFILKNLINHGHLSVDNTFAITTIFTAISIVRGYFWRRLFNRIEDDGHDNNN